MKSKLFEEMGFAKIDHHRAERCGKSDGRARWLKGGIVLR